MPDEKEDSVTKVTPAPEGAEKVDLATPPEGYTAEDWQDLSDAEKEGILDSLSGGDDADLEEDEAGKPLDEAALKAIAGEGEQPVEAGPVPEEPAAEPTETPAPAETPKPAEDGTILTDDQLLSFRPMVADSELPAVDTVPDEIQDKLDELDEKFDAGDTKLTEYNRERDTLNRQITMENIKTRETARADIQWQKEQGHFLRSRPDYLGEKQADGKYKGTAKSNALFGALGEMVKSLTTDPLYANASGMKILIDADKAVKEAFGITVAAPVRKEEPAPRKPPAKLPEEKNLGDLPAAAPASVEGAYAALDNLHGQAYEDALERLPEAVRDKYLNSRT